jgi:hypothetical protein
LRVVTQCPSHCHSTFVRCVIIIQLLSNFHSMFVGLPSNFRPHSVRHPSLFCPTFVTIPSNVRPYFIWRLSINVHLSTSVRRRSSLLTHYILQIICTTYICIRYHILQTVSNVL